MCDKLCSFALLDGDIGCSEPSDVLLRPSDHLIIKVGRPSSASCFAKD